MSNPPVEWFDVRQPWDGGPAPDPRNLPYRADRLRLPGEEEAPGGPWIRDLHHYARPIQSYSAVPDATAPAESILLLQESSSKRNWLSLRNASATVDIYISFATPASVQSPLLLAAGQTMLFDVVVPQTDMWVLASGPSGFLAYSWSTIAL